MYARTCVDYVLVVSSDVRGEELQLFGETEARGEREHVSLVTWVSG